MERSILIDLSGVSKTYRMGEVSVEALKETELQIFAGEFVVILGPSGSGKSTLLHIVGGMDSPSSGRVLFQGEDVARMGGSQLTTYRRQKIGFVFQFFNLIPDLTARENVSLAADLVEQPLATEQVLAEVGMELRMDHFPAQLSGGEQQRVSIARAIVKNPPLLLCDEPTGSLDALTGRIILELLVKINRERGTTVVVVTHNAAISAIADRTIRMSSGKIVELTENPNPLSPDKVEW